MHGITNCVQSELLRADWPRCNKARESSGIPWSIGSRIFTNTSLFVRLKRQSQCGFHDPRMYSKNEDTGEAAGAFHLLDFLSFEISKRSLMVIID